MNSAAPSFPRVSVVMLTYNHAEFIRQALDSVLMQQVDFSYEVIIGEDCSTDQTRHIVEEYARRYPAIVKPIYHPTNGGMGRNLQACLAAARGEYLAPLEGDDYWTDPHKLRKQVDLLAARPEYSMCFHEVQVIREAPYEVRGTTCNDDVYTFEQLLASERTVPMTSSLLLRNHLVSWPEWLFAAPTMDYPLVILQGEQGRLIRVAEVMSVYRLHAGGIWSAADPALNRRRYIEMYEQLAAHYAATPRGATVRQALYKHCLNIADSLIQQGTPQLAPHFIRRALAYGPGFRATNLKSLVGVTGRWLQASLPTRFSTSSTLQAA